MIEEAARATGRSIRSLAANAGISDTRWRQIVKGWQPGPEGTKLEVHAPALTLARMAFVAGVEPDNLAEAGRPDAAELLIRVIHSPPGDLPTIPGTAASGPEVHSATPGKAVLVNMRSHIEPDEIDLIYASRMSAREKLLRIRQVLELRAQAEAEAAQAQQTAPAEAGADVQETQQS